MGRNGVWHYRRRVPTELVESLGRKEVQFSLGTRTLKEAKMRRAAEDLKWDMQFERASRALACAGDPSKTGDAPTPTRLQPLSEGEAIRLVQAYVEETDQRARGNLNRDPPESDEQQAEMIEDAEYGRQILRSRSDPRADERISRTAARILRGKALPLDEEGIRYLEFAEQVRRGLLELDERKIARLKDDHRYAFFDQQFSPARRIDVTFGDLGDQFLQLVEQEAEANAVSAKWIDKQRATLALLREIIGDDVLARDIDYDACLRARQLISETPANRTKLHGSLTLDEAISKAARARRSVLSRISITSARSYLKVRLILIRGGSSLAACRRRAVRTDLSSMAATSSIVIRSLVPNARFAAIRSLWILAAMSSFVPMAIQFQSTTFIRPRLRRRSTCASWSGASPRGLPGRRQRCARRISSTGDRRRGSASCTR